MANKKREATYSPGLNKVALELWCSPVGQKSHREKIKRKEEKV